MQIDYSKVREEISNIKKDICKIADEIDKLKQADLNLKYLIGKSSSLSLNSTKDKDN